jgi:molybdopterin molybdotransferase
MPVAEALDRLIRAAHAEPLREECISIGMAAGRVLVENLVARRDAPPFTMSAMDGYALRAGETGDPGPWLRVIGESAAGRPFPSGVGTGEAVRIFTGARLPEGADAILIQEDAERDGNHVRAQNPVAPGRFVRVTGRDFFSGSEGPRAGQRLSPRDLALIAGMNIAEIRVAARPLIAILATGDELAIPGADLAADRTIASNAIAITAMAREAGADVLDLGIAPDNTASLRDAIGRARDGQARLLVTIGGASVGQHDLVRPTLADMGAVLDFYRIAMRPGKPLNFGRLGSMLVLGLPGNPGSAIVCATLFLLPLIAAIQGDAAAAADRTMPARIGRALSANDEREDYLRARLSFDLDDRLVVHPMPDQDSSLLSVLAQAEALLIRAPFAPAATIGESCRILKL